MSRGGRREGAGRKPLGAKAKSETITLRVSAELKDAMRKEAENMGISVGEMMEHIFLHPEGRKTSRAEE